WGGRAHLMLAPTGALGALGPAQGFLLFAWGGVFPTGSPSGQDILQARLATWNRQSSTA
ncbi:MAG: hypothetical protein JWR89_5157, partial [Tardiphaga sp.]|nr:hypothetical protein [Tardiphaga sp.]